MDFSSLQMPWGENIRRKWEEISTSSAIVQNPYMYVDAVGEHLKKVIDEVDDWFTSSVEDRSSVLPLKHDITREVLESKVEHVNNLPSEEIASAELDAESVSAGTSAHTSEDVTNIDERVDRRKNFNLTSAEDTIEVPVTDRSDGTQENNNSVEVKVASCVDSGSIRVSTDEDCLSESCQVDLFERESVILCCTSVTDTEGAGFTDEFEDVDLEDFWDVPESYELVLSSNQAVRNMPYKERLKNAIISKVLPRKGYKNVGSCNRHLQAGKKLETGAASSVSIAAISHETSSLGDSCENDWELI